MSRRLVRLRTFSGGDVFVNPERIESVGTWGSGPNAGKTVIRVGSGEDVTVEGTPAEVADAINRALAGEDAAEVPGAGETPAPSPSPEPPDPVALLAEGKRLRFVRDAGAMGDRVPAEVDVVVADCFSSKSGSSVYHGFVGRADDDNDIEYSPLFQSEWTMTRVAAAGHTVALLDDLGYRFESVVE